MSRRDLKNKIAELQKARRVGRGAKERAVRGRLRLALMDEEAKLVAPRFQRAKRPEDRVLEPEAKELWGEDKTRWKVREEAARRVLEKFDEYMARPMGNTGDLTSCAKDLTPEDKARLCGEVARQLEEMEKMLEGGGGGR